MKIIHQIRMHLKETKWNYWQHLGHSIKQSKILMVLALKSVVHGVLPWIWINSGPLGVANIYREIRRLHHVQKILKKQTDGDQ